MRPEDFADTKHAAIFSAIAKMETAGQHADAVLLHDHFAALEGLDAVGGADYLARLAASFAPVVALPDYAHTVADRALRRRLVQAGESLVDEAHTVTLEGTAVDILAAHVAGCQELGGHGGRRPPVTIATAADEAMAATERAAKGEETFIPFGLAKVDKALGGASAQDLIIIAARPGVGKSTLGINFALNMAASGYRVGWWNLEMSNRGSARFALARLSGIPVERQKSGEVRGEDFGRLMDARDTLRDWPLFLMDTPGLTVADIEAEARNLRCEVAFVDHLRLIRGPYRGFEFRGETERVGAISSALKEMAKRLNIPVVCLAQLSRAVEGRDEKRPNLSDLRQSGQIEEDADAVCFVYRDSYYLQTTPRHLRDDKWATLWEEHKNKADLIVAKRRDGEPRTVELYADMAAAYFADEAPAEPQVVVQRDMF